MDGCGTNFTNTMGRVTRFSPPSYNAAWPLIPDTETPGHAFGMQRCSQMRAVAKFHKGPDLNQV